MTDLDPRYISFSQAQGYEPLPQALQLEELSERSRVALWNVIYEVSDVSVQYEKLFSQGMDSVLHAMHTDFFWQPLNSWHGSYDMLTSLQPFLMSKPLNKVFDLLTFIMRHRQAPKRLINHIAETFERHQLAYLVDKTPPATIYPIGIHEEGRAIVDALSQLRSAGYSAAHGHLQQSVGHINQQDWAGSVRESINAVESVARQIAPDAKTLGEALKLLQRRGLLKHTALQNGFSNLYGYTNDEQGIRHPLLDKPAADVGQDEALFMFGACASFASYLSRKQTALSE